MFRSRTHGTRQARAHAAAHEIVRHEQFNVLLRTHMQMMIGDLIGTIKTIAAMYYIKNA